MRLNKLNLLKIVLCLGALYYLTGAFAHFFGLTLFPFYDSRLYTPYHDSILGLVGMVIALFLLAIAKNPVKNIDTLNIVIICAILATIFSFAIIWKVDFAALGAPDKKIQTVAEGILGVIFVVVLLWLYPRQKDINGNKTEINRNKVEIK